ncbi:MAG TPA: SseB family protein [Malonomonas sp.]
MTELDQALERYVQDENQQAAYYQLILNSDFYIPIEEDDSDTPLNEKAAVTPLILQADNKPYLMLFDSEERLSSWAKQPVNYVLLAGFKVAELSTPELHWALNTGVSFAKQFVPEEIRWLKEVASSEPEAEN